MQTKQTYLRRIAIIVMSLMLCLNVGCSIQRFANNMMAPDELLDSVADPNSELDYKDEAAREAGAYQAEAQAAQTYYDEKTGLAISKVQYYAYNITDAFKYYGLYIAIPCAVIGFLMRRLIKNSASLRKLGLVLELGIPIAYVVFAYILSAVADSV